jgi:hypothetical protein
MQYVLFVGIFGLPILVCVGMLATRVLDRFAPDDPPAPERFGAIPPDDPGSRERELADTFFSAPVEQASPSFPT